MSCPAVTQGAGSPALSASLPPIFPGKGGTFVREFSEIQRVDTAYLITFNSTTDGSTIKTVQIRFQDDGKTALTLESGNNGNFADYLLQLGIMNNSTCDFTERKIMLAILPVHNKFDEEALKLFEDLSKNQNWWYVIRPVDISHLSGPNGEWRGPLLFSDPKGNLSDLKLHP
ncbi:MAG TPA: hypothetical protein VLE89_04355 [Chlamydiales bacterium]|nr:hypothetical protein [Chlamydiales bacterium]